MQKILLAQKSDGRKLYKIMTDRGAFIRYEIKDTRACLRSLVEIWAPRLLIAAFVLFMVLFGLPGDPLHGASKYQPKTCAGALECAQEWGEEPEEEGGEYQEEEGDAVTVYDYRGRA